MAIHEYPYTEYAENGGCCDLMHFCKRAGVKLAVVGDSLQLLDKCNFVLSQVKIQQATVALQDEHGHNLDDYVYQLIIRDNKLVAIDGNGNEYALTIPFATSAGSTEEAEHALTADTATRATLATSATEATHAAQADYATSAGTAQTAQSTTQAAHATTADQATTATAATTAQTAVRAQQDSLGNTITAAYVANITLNSTTGAISFYAKDGSLITSITPIYTDGSGEPVSAYVKSVIISDQADYVLVEHGDGTSETYWVNYSHKAWKDTVGNIIKNVYFKRAAIVYDQETNEPWLVFYNGENSEVSRLQIVAQSAQYADEAGHAITADSATNATNADHATTADSATNDADGDDIRRYYAHSLTVSGNSIQLKSKSGLLLNSVTAPYAVSATTAESATSATNADYAAQSGLAADADHAIAADSAITAQSATNATNADHATTADSATEDGDGNVIKETYGASLRLNSYDNHTFFLVNNDNENISSVTLPMAQVYNGFFNTADLDSDQMITLNITGANAGYLKMYILPPYDTNGSSGWQQKLMDFINAEVYIARAATDTLTLYVKNPPAIPTTLYFTLVIPKW